MIGLLHTTQTKDGTGRALSRSMVRDGKEPHVIYEPSTNEQWVLHAPFARAKSLYNAPGGVETNNRERDGQAGCDVWQVEIVAFAESIESKDDAWYENLKRFLRGWSIVLDIPYEFPRRFATSYGDNVRMTFAEWNDPNLAGWFGHCHVPENEHWDPGNIDLSRLLINAAQPSSFLSGEGDDMYVQVTDTFNVGQIWYLFWDGPPVNKQLYRKHVQTEWQSLQHRYEAELFKLPWSEIAGAIEVA
jgi:hypothetical protein